MTLLLLFIFIYIGINIRSSPLIAVPLLILFTFFLVIKIRKATRKTIRVAINAVALLLGFSLSFIRPSFMKNHYQGLVVECKENYFVFSSSLEKFYIYSPVHPYEIGDVLDIVGEKKELDFVTLESEFDFKQYLNSKGIYSELSITNIEVKFATPFRVNSVKKNFLYKLDEGTRGVLGPIMFNYSSKGEFADLNRELHLVRLISSSGIFLYFVLKVLKKLLSLIIKKEKIVDLLSLILFLPYVIFTFPRFVVIKFIVLRWMVFVNRHLLKNRFKYLDIISVSGIFFLLFDYHLGFQDGFVLSYLIPIISLFYNGSFKIQKKWRKRVLLTLLINVAFIPFVIKFYNELSLLSIPLQFIYAPIYLFLFALGLFGFIGLPIIPLINNVSHGIYSSLNAISIINIKIYASSFNPVIFVLYEAAFFLFFYYLSIRLRPLKNIFAITLVGLFSLHIIPIKNVFKDYVTFINVGQGDSTLIQYKNSTILVDTGGLKNKDIATEVLIPYFKKNCIYQIDTLITTHDDFDHMGGVNSLITNFKVKRYVKDYTLFPLYVDGLKLTNYNVYPDLWKEENDSSLVIGFNVNNFNYLIMGDAPTKIETAIMSNNEYIPCDILKVGHHGSKTSTSDAFIKYLKPTVAIISCGKNNYYGHPHKEVLAILTSNHVQIRRTDVEGSITF